MSYRDRGNSLRATALDGWSKPAVSALSAQSQSISSYLPFDSHRSSVIADAANLEVQAIVCVVRKRPALFLLLFVSHARRRTFLRRKRKEFNLPRCQRPVLSQVPPRYRVAASPALARRQATVTEPDLPWHDGRRSPALTLAGAFLTLSDPRRAFLLLPTT